MMDGRPLYPHGHHPVRRNRSIDGLYEATALSRTEHPVRYYYIDFDLSVRFAEGQPHLVLGDVGREDKVPELSADVPYDPFKVDVFSLGNLYHKEFVLVSYRIWSPIKLNEDANRAVQKYHNMEFLLPMIERMKQHHPAQRPNMDDVESQWKRIQAESSFMAPWRCSSKSETMIERALNDTVAAALGSLKNLKKSFVH